MGVIPRSETTIHEFAGVRFTGLVAPSKGSTELMAWQTEVPPGTEPAIHQVTREEIVVILSGLATVHYDGSAVEAKAGDAIVVPPDTDFALENAGDETLRVLACMSVEGRARMHGATETLQLPWMV
jgi:quercetin dioxygenase-like cupin family protein